MLDYEVLFSESASRFIVEVKKDNQKGFESCLKGSEFGLIGCVCGEKRLTIHNRENKKVVDAGIELLRNSWMKTFDEFR
jgi:phosphoribosylformylglycinamidine synthase